MNYLQDIYLTNFNVVCNFGGYFSITKDEDWTYRRHKFDQCKFYFITEGKCTIEIEDNVYKAEAGDWFFIPAGAEHGYKNDKSGSFKKYWLHFDIYPNADLFSALSLPYVVKLSNISKVKRLFEALLKAKNSNELTEKLKVKACLINLISEYIKTAKPNGVNVQSRTDERLDKVLRYINENLDKDLSLDVLAKKYYSHPNHFIRAFKDKTGFTPAKYVTHMKLEASKRLLEETDLTVEEITEKFAFANSAHFSRIFKQYYNTPPAKYRAFYKKSK